MMSQHGFEIQMRGKLQDELENARYFLKRAKQSADIIAKDFCDNDRTVFRKLTLIHSELGLVRESLRQAFLDARDKGGEG